MVKSIFVPDLQNRRSWKEVRMISVNGLSLRLVFEDRTEETITAVNQADLHEILQSWETCKKRMAKRSDDSPPAQY